MWAIKILSGKDAGKIFQLKEGTHTMGRSTHVDIQISSQSVSKVHAQLLVTEDKLIISDTQSSNGVFVNGVKVKNQVLKSGDKVSLSDIIVDIIHLPANVSLVPSIQQNLVAEPGPQENTNAVANYGFSGSGALDTASAPQPTGQMRVNHQADLTLVEKVDQYIDAVALPAVYKFSEKFDMKYVVASFVIIFVILVTILTILPVIQISRDFIVDESRRRTESLARQIVLENRQFVMSNNEINISVDDVLKEPGVETAFVISASDGHIMAPLSKRGEYSKIPFLQEARKKGSQHFTITGSKISVSLPILNFNAATGEPAAQAYAIVLYNMDKVALDVERALGLIIQILIITMMMGGVLYFFLYRVLLHPLNQLNSKVDSALKTGTPNIELESPTPIFQKLIANINSSLSRMSSGDEGGGHVNSGDKMSEATELVKMFPVAAFALSKESERIISGNDFINGHPLFDDPLLDDKYIDDLTDSALVDTLKELLDKANDNPNMRQTNLLTLRGGERFEITVKPVTDGADISYFLFSITEIYEDEDYKE